MLSMLLGGRQHLVCGARYVLRFEWATLVLPGARVASDCYDEGYRLVVDALGDGLFWALTVVALRRWTGVPLDVAGAAVVFAVALVVAPVAEVVRASYPSGCCGILL